MTEGQRQSDGSTEPGERPALLPDTGSTVGAGLTLLLVVGAAVGMALVGGRRKR